jgi:hypothetical protein
MRKTVCKFGVLFFRDEDGFRVGMTEDVVHLVGAEFGKDGDSDRAHGGDREIRDPPIGFVFGKDRDPVSRGDTPLVEDAGQRADTFSDFGVGEGLPIGHRQRGPVRVQLDASIEQMSQRHFFQ